MSDRTTYTIEGDTLLIRFDGGELRFRRSLPDNTTGLRAFPLQRDTEDVAGARKLMRGRLALEAGCIRLEPADEEAFEDSLLVWPGIYAAGFDDAGGLIYSNRHGRLRVGDEVVVSGSPLSNITPVLDAGYLRLKTIPEECSGPYWLVEDILVVE